MADTSKGIIHYGAAGTVLRRYVHGTGADEPLVAYEGASIAPSSEHFLMADHQGSIVLAYDRTLTQQIRNSYDEYGIPGTGNSGRFQYTGQAWISELGMFYYKARIYSPTLGRFLQTDPIGYADQINLYAYVGNDPIDGRDPSGTDSLWVRDANGITTVVIPVRFSGEGATPDAIGRVIARAASLNTGSPKLRIEIVSSDKAMNGVLNRMDYSSGLDFKHFGRNIGEGVNRIGGNRGHINSDATDKSGSPRDPEGALLHDTLHFAGYPDGYNGGGGTGDGQGGRFPSSPVSGLTNSNIMANRGGNSLTPGQSAVAAANRSSKTCSVETGSHIRVCS